MHVLSEIPCWTLEVARQKDSRKPCPHEPNSHEEKRNTKLIDKVVYLLVYEGFESNRSRKPVELVNRSGKAIHRKCDKK